VTSSDPHVDPPNPHTAVDAPGVAAGRPAAVLPYADPTTDRDRDGPPSDRKPLPPEVPPILCGLGLLVLLDALERLVALPQLACVAWYVVARFRREKHVPRPWLLGMQLATLWSAAWTINAMRIVRGWRGWLEILWEYDAQLRWSVYFVAAGIAAFAVCEVGGRVVAWRRCPAASPALPVPTEAP
jgi:hypothetical protein